MLLTDALTLVKRLIYSGKTHADYKRTVDLADTYKTFITGDGIEKKLIKFVQREDAALFAQRILLTRSTTPAVASSIRQPFNKVTRNDRIRKTVKLGNESKSAAVDKMVASFYGAPRKKNKGLEYWLKTRFVEMQFTDPNAWVVIEWDAPEDAAQVIYPRPFEVTAAMATNFFIVNDVVKWLFVKQDITYKTTDGKKPNAEEKEPATKAGYRYTLYDEQVSVVFEQIDRKFLERDGYQLGPNESFAKVGNFEYLVKVADPKVGYVPAFRIGYKRDEQTSGRTFVNPWHDSLCYFEKSLKTVSELDLTMTLHTFPQKLQYVNKCQGMTREDGTRRACNGGIVQGTTAEQCTACKGMGYKVHTTAQDAILLPMPDTPADMIPLENILVYKSPQIELIKFQNEYTQQLERQAHQAVFNSQVFVKKAAGGNSSSAAPIQTATEADFNMQSVYDALEPFTEKFSEIWKELVTIFAVISGESLDSIDVSHDFPADYKLKTQDVLLNERKAASESSAPAFLMETIDDDLAKIIYAGDQLGLLKYQVKRRYFPFTGKKDDEIALLLASEFVLESAKILYSNFEQIFKELETDNPSFWMMNDLAKQRATVEAKVIEWEQKIKDAKPAPALNMFRPATGATGAPGDTGNGGDGSGGNPGTNEPA